MSLEQRFNQLKRTSRIQSAFLGCGMCLALGLSLWSIFVGGGADVPLSGHPISPSFDTLSVRHLLVRNDKGEEVAVLSADKDGYGHFNMYANGNALFSVFLDDDTPLMTMDNSHGKTGLILGLHDDARGKLFVYNSKEQLCAGITADDKDFGGVFTTNSKGGPLVVMGRGRNDLGDVAAFTKDGKRVYVSKRSD